MKSFFAFFIAALLAIPTMASAINIDGTAEAAYGSALATQVLATTYGDSTNGVTLASAPGSELDAAYGFISNSVMYLVIAGNVQNNFNKTLIFIDSIPGQGENTLTNVNPNIDFNGLNRMGWNGTNGVQPGLTFDAGFAPDYIIETGSGGGVTHFNYAELRVGGFGTYLGNSTPSNNTLTAGTNPFGIKGALNDLNTNGVTGDTNGCAGVFSPGPGQVRTGLELAIPISAVSSGPVTVVKVCLILTSSGFDSASNQILPPIATNGCVANLGEIRNVNLSTLPGQHYFVVPVIGCAYALSPLSATYATTGGVGSVAMTAAGGCSWAATSQVSWVTITSGASGSGNGTVNYTVATNTTTVARWGTILIGGQTFTINQYGQPLTLPIDGTVETNQYGALLSLQELGSSYGDDSTAAIDYSNGSELDGAYGFIQNGVLYIMLTGNLESNFNRLHLFFETAAGGEHTLVNTNPNVDNNGLNRMGTNGNGVTNGPGLTFDAGFAPNYWVSMFCGGSPFAMNAFYAQLSPGGTNGYYLGTTISLTNGVLFGGTNPFGIQATVNNLNTLGVAGDSSWDDPTVYGQSNFMTGVELAIPLGALGNPSGNIRICAIVGSAAHDDMSNQTLGPIWDGTTDNTFAHLSLGDPALIDLSTVPGTHYFVVSNAAPFAFVITNISLSNQDVHVSWTTQTGGFVYQLQSARVLSNGMTWASVGAATNGTGSVITQVDSLAGTNKPALFYRVDQTHP